MNGNSYTEALQKPFLPDEIEWRVGATNKEKTMGFALAYVTNRAIQNRLDETFGVFGWKNEFKEWKAGSQICGISIYDTEKKEWITKWDGADDSNVEGTKGGLSDAMKRAGYQWGIGRYLYKLPDAWVPLVPKGRSVALKTIPTLPAWALPEGYILTTPQLEKPPESKPTSAPQENGAPKRSTRMTSLMKKKGLSSDEMRTEVEKLLFKGVIKTMDVTAMTDIDFNVYLKTLDRHIQQVS